MANNYVQFSALLDVGSAENVRHALDIAVGHVNEDTDECGFEYGPQSQFDPASTAVWIYAEESGDPESVADYVAKVAHALGLTGKWGMTYSLSCTRPKLGEFGGGAVVVDLLTGNAQFLDAHAWMADRGGDPYQGSAPPRNHSADL